MESPLSRYVFSFGRWPQSVNWLPNPRLPLLALKVAEAWLGTSETPGSKVASEAQSRPFSGNSRTVLASTVELTVDEVAVCTSGGAAVTSTVWLTCPTFRLRFSACCSPTVRVIPFCTSLLKPAAVIVTS